MFYGILSMIYSGNVPNYLTNIYISTSDKTNNKPNDKPNDKTNKEIRIPNETSNPSANPDNINYLKYYLKGAVAGMTGILISHPIDTIKTHIQTGHSLKTFQTGLRTLYRGLMSPLIGVSFEKAIVFGTYNYALRKTDNIPLSGAIAGLSASVVVSPYERFKILKQNSTSYSRKDLSLEFLFRGLSATFTRETPGFAIYFTVYEALKYHTFTKHGREIEYINSFLYGGIAGCIAWIFIYPQDRIKTILQSSSSYGDLGSSGIKNIIKDIYAKGGLRHFYSGFSWAVARAIVLHSGTFCMMEILNRQF
jgi:solute carrier family 25 carnitine/acylcarnitine transporter 20/29